MSISKSDMSSIPPFKDDIEWTIIFAILDEARINQQYVLYNDLVYAAERLLGHNRLRAYPDQVNDQIERLIKDRYLIDLAVSNADGSPKEQAPAVNPLIKTFAFAPSYYKISDKGKKALDQMNEEIKPKKDVEPIFNGKLHRFFVASLLTIVALVSFYLSVTNIGIDWALIGAGTLLIFYGHAEKVELGLGTFRLMGSVGFLIFFFGVIILLKNMGQLPFNI